MLQVMSVLSFYEVQGQEKEKFWGMSALLPLPPFKPDVMQCYIIGLSGILNQL